MLVSSRTAGTLASALAGALPREACGLLLGPKSRGRVSVIEAVISRVTSTHGQFEIPDYELRRIKAWGEDRGLTVVAVFHSHPSGDRRLSAADRSALRHSEWPWVIVTRERQDTMVVLTAYRAGDAAPIDVRISDAMPPGSHSDSGETGDGESR
jgi:proteasome lid subunit RPN8/RPN11